MFNKQQFIKYCIDNNFTIYEIQNEIIKLANKEISNIILMDFLNFEIPNGYELLIPENMNFIDYCNNRMNKTAFIRNFSYGERKFVTINNIISCYIKFEKFK